MSRRSIFTSGEAAVKEAREWTRSSVTEAERAAFCLQLRPQGKQSEVSRKKTSRKIKFNAKFERRNFKVKYFVIDKADK